MFVTSKNKVEQFADAIWNDGKHDLKPKAVGDDGSKVVTSAPAEEPKDLEKLVKDKFGQQKALTEDEKADETVETIAESDHIKEE